MTALASRLLAEADEVGALQTGLTTGSVVMPRNQAVRIVNALRAAAAALSDHFVDANKKVPEGREVVAKLVNRIERGGKTTTFIRPTSLGMDMPLGEYPLYLGPTTQPPGDGWVLHGRVNGYLPRQQAIEIHADAPLPDWLTSVRDLRVTVAAAPSAKGVAK